MAARKNPSVHSSQKPKYANGIRKIGMAKWKCLVANCRVRMREKKKPTMIKSEPVRNKCNKIFLF